MGYQGPLANPGEAEGLRRGLMAPAQRDQTLRSRQAVVNRQAGKIQGTSRSYFPDVSEGVCVGGGFHPVGTPSFRGEIPAAA